MTVSQQLLETLSSDERRELEVSLALLRASPELRESWACALDIALEDLPAACLALLGQNTPQSGTQADVVAVSSFLADLTEQAAELAARRVARQTAANRREEWAKTWLASCERQLESVYKSLEEEGILLEAVDAETQVVIDSLIKERAKAEAEVERAVATKAALGEG